MPKKMFCNKCGTSGETVIIQGLETSYPPEWVTVTVGTLPIRNYLLCGNCKLPVLVVLGAA